VQRIREARLSPWTGRQLDGSGVGPRCRSVGGAAGVGHRSNGTVQGSGAAGGRVGPAMGRARPSTGVVDGAVEGEEARWAWRPAGGHGGRLRAWRPVEEHDRHGSQTEGVATGGRARWPAWWRVQ
jgi:hypothetical protein